MGGPGRGVFLHIRRVLGAGVLVALVGVFSFTSVEY